MDGDARSKRDEPESDDSDERDELESDDSDERDEPEEPSEPDEPSEPSAKDEPSEPGGSSMALPLLTLFVIAATTLGFEILLTRVFAIVLFSAHSFVAISLAMLGTGAGALAAHVLGERTNQKAPAHKLIAMAVFAALVLAAVWVSLQVEFVPQEAIDPETGEVVKEHFSARKRAISDNPDLMETWKLYAVIPLVFAPFLVSGYLQALVFREAVRRFGLFYGVDLLGAPAGSTQTRRVSGDSFRKYSEHPAASPPPPIWM